MNLNYIDERFAKTLTKIYTKMFFDFVTSLESRASFPIHVILEEAHRYVQNDSDINILGYNIFDRITKEDADIMVVGPSQISGTAGLIGAVKAYEQVSGEPISDETLDTAMNELVTTGELVTKSASDEEVEALIAYIKAKLAAGELETEDDIRKAIKEGEQKFGVSLDESEEQQIVDFMLKIKKLGLDPNVLLDQAADLYSKFGDELLNKATDDGFLSGLGNIVNSIADFFKGLFKK